MKNASGGFIRNINEIEQHYFFGILLKDLPILSILNFGTDLE